MDSREGRVEDGLGPEVDRLHSSLRPYIDELEAMIGEAEAQPASPGETPLPAFGGAERRLFALFNTGAMAVAVLDRRGAVLAATPAFTEGGFENLIDVELAEAAVGRAAPLLQPPETGAGGGLMAYAAAGHTAGWRLPPEIHAAARGGRGGRGGRVVVIAVRTDPGLKPLRQAAEAYGLTGQQTRVALETIRLGSIKTAAAGLGVSYQTAREALAAAMKRVGARRLPGLVTRLSTLAFGVLPGRSGSADLLSDTWGLSERQIALAGLVAEGLSRAEAARLLGVGEAVAKKELDAVFSLLEVGSGAALARRLVEVRALSWLTEATGGDVGFVDDHAEPLGIVPRADNTQVAFSDYGPASGRPVLVVHSSMTTRIVSRRLIRALQAVGRRPIAIDRPGFGLTDPIAGLPAGRQDPFEAATADVGLVLRHLKIRRIDVVSRGAAQFMVALRRAMPEALGRVVLVNPGPPYRESGRGTGPLAVIKEAFVRNPALVGVVAAFLAGQMTHGRITRMMRQWVRGSAPDELAAADPEIANDFYRSARMFATGRYQGFLQEQAAIARAARPAPTPGTKDWHVLLGDSDVLYDPQVVLDYWRGLLPDARFTVVPASGRFLAMTHADLVAATLAGRAPA
jgi:DNA-binding CsgD family transcriptional regulator